MPAARQSATTAWLLLVAQESSKVARGTCSSLPVSMPLSLRCTTLAAVSMPVVYDFAIANAVPEDLTVDCRDHLVSSGQSLLQHVDVRLDRVPVDAVVRQQSRQIPNL